MYGIFDSACEAESKMIHEESCGEVSSKGLDSTEISKTLRTSHGALTVADLPIFNCLRVKKLNSFSFTLYNEDIPLRLKCCREKCCVSSAKKTPS